MLMWKENLRMHSLLPVQNISLAQLIFHIVRAKYMRQRKYTQFVLKVNLQGHFISRKHIHGIQILWLSL